MKLTQRQINAGKRYDDAIQSHDRLTKITYLAALVLIPIIPLIAYLQQ